MAKRTVSASDVIATNGNSKIGNVLNVSLLPFRTCNCSIGCAKKNECYAHKFVGLYPQVKAAWTHNTDLAESDPVRFFQSLNEQIAAKRTPPKMFRFHVGGDCPSEAYMAEAIKFAQRHPSIKMWFPTKRYTWAAKYAESVPENLVLALSAWPGADCPNPAGFPVAYVQDGTESRVPSDARECKGDCVACGHACWNLKRGQAVVFYKHK